VDRAAERRCVLRVKAKIKAGDGLTIVESKHVFLVQDLKNFIPMK
jgi:hypothetical protein